MSVVERFFHYFVRQPHVSNIWRGAEKLDTVNTFPGSPQPEDLFEPHMPEVKVLPDMDAFFIDLKRTLVREKAERHLFIVTPDRTTIKISIPPPSRESDKAMADDSKMLRSDRPLDISVISYTKLEALMKDQERTRCIPFLGYLIAFAYAGHRVLAFEGHPSAFESGVRKCDVLFVDSAMIPFLQQDWTATAFRVMRPGSRIFVHDRQTYTLSNIGPSRKPPGWQYTEPDGEASYVNCLLTTLTKGPFPSVKIVSGRALPHLENLAEDPDELDWIYGLPFQYDQLDSEQVARFIIGLSKRETLTQGVLNAQLLLSGGQPRPVSFKIVVSREADGKGALTITKR
jgi:hypothetical protein